MAKSTKTNPMGLSTNPTFYGKCKGKTAEGKPCHHKTVYNNGLCFQHGGATSPEEKKEILKRSRQLFAKQKKRALKKLAKEQKKWRQRPSEQCSQTEPAKASINTASPAGAAWSSSASQATSAASGMGPMESRLARARERVSKEHSQTSPAQRPQRDGQPYSATLRQADSLGQKDPKAVNAANNGIEPNSKEKGPTSSTCSNSPSCTTQSSEHLESIGQNNKDRGNGKAAHSLIAESDKEQETSSRHLDGSERDAQALPDKGEDIAGARALASVPLTGYSRGNRGVQEWRQVGVNHLGVPLVVIPEWHGLSVPRGVGGQHNLNAQFPDPSLVEPRCDYDY